jgi:hypothetical protein
LQLSKLHIPSANLISLLPASGFDADTKFTVFEPVKYFRIPSVIHNVQRNTAIGTGLFFQIEICGMKIKTRINPPYESRGKRMAIDRFGVEKILVFVE